MRISIGRPAGPTAGSVNDMASTSGTLPTSARHRAFNRAFKAVCGNRLQHIVDRFEVEGFDSEMVVRGNKDHRRRFGVFFGEGTPEGEVAFCYTGAAAAYPGAARDLLLAFPRIGHNLCVKFAGTPRLAETLYGAEITSFSPATQLQGSSFVCQAHTELTRNILGMKPEVALGLSSGETNSLMAFGVWHDLDR